MGTSEPREVYQAADAHDAYCVRDALEQAGIETIVVGDVLQAALGTFSITSLEPRVLVHVEDYDRACKIIRQLDAAQDNARRDEGRWRCPQCGEMNEASFEICWNCQSRSPAIG